MKRYKIAVLAGTILMGISSFAACLASGALMAAGNVGLIISMAIMVYGFNSWQP